MYKLMTYSWSTCTCMEVYNKSKFIIQYNIQDFGNMENGQECMYPRH